MSKRLQRRPSQNWAGALRIGALQIGALQTGALAWMLTACGGADATSTSGALNLAYELGRIYTGENSNTLTITPEGDSAGLFDFSVGGTNASIDLPEDTFVPLDASVVTFSYAAEGTYTVQFRIQKKNGRPVLHEVLSWEYSEEVPDPPVISFQSTVTNMLANKLLVSDSRASNSDAIWLSGDLTLTAPDDEGGAWFDLESSDTYVDVTLPAGDGVKVVDGRLRNIYGNVGELGVSAEVLLKQNPPTDCSADPLSYTIANNKLSLMLSATDDYDTYYTVVGDVRQPIDTELFADGDVVFVFLEPTPGVKTVSVVIEDVAGNSCLEETFDITIDPDYSGEGISVAGATYWSTESDLTISVAFEHFPSQEPLEIKLSGDISGSSVGRWLAYGDPVDVTLSPNSAGSHTILAQYRDGSGTESYLIFKRIFLNPSMVLNDLGGGLKGVATSDIIDATSLTINGCVETYDEVDYQASYDCTPNAATVDVIYAFPDGPDLTLSATP